MSGRRSTPSGTARSRRCPKLRAGAVETVAVAMAIATASCSATNVVPEAGIAATDPSAAVAAGPADRTVAVVTTPCGSAPASIGSAVQLDATTVLTAAHVVAGAGDVAVVEHRSLPVERSWPAFSPGALFEEAMAGEVVAFDADRDLALVGIDRLRTDGSELARPEFGTAAEGETVDIHGAATARIEGSVALRTIIEADEVRGRGRVERDGYRLDATTGRGDSGAGVWSADGRLVGVVFAVSSDDDARTWAVSGREIAEFVEAMETQPVASYRCDEATSRLVSEPP